MTRIIVFGVSGVGKTTACREYVARNPEYIHVTASELIRKSTGVSAESLRTASAVEILANQVILEKALEIEMERRGATKAIIDGQCVLDNGSEIVVLPAGLISPLKPTGLILLEAPADVVFKRRLKDRRTRPPRTVEEIYTQIEMNRTAVQAYAANLRVPFRVTDENTSLESAIASLVDTLP